MEEAEAAEAEASEKTNTLDVPMHLRIDKDLDERLRQQANGEGIPTSALVRRLLRQAMQQGLTVLSQATSRTSRVASLEKSSKVTERPSRRT